MENEFGRPIRELGARNRDHLLGERGLDARRGRHDADPEFTVSHAMPSLVTKSPAL
jgi:hypothetical protein